MHYRGFKIRNSNLSDVIFWNYKSLLNKLNPKISYLLRVDIEINLAAQVFFFLCLFPISTSSKISKISVIRIRPKLLLQVC